MNISPASTASSSFELYSNSEPPGRGPQVQTTTFNSPSRKDQLHLAVDGQKPNFRDPTSSQSTLVSALQVSYMVGHEGMRTPSEPGANTVGIPNGESHKQHKRKWEGDVDATIQEEQPSGKQQENSSHPRENIGHTSRACLSNEDAGESLKDWSSKKRSKPNESSKGIFSRSGDPFQSPILPAELWQHIFCFVPPVFLGRLLRVNRAFHAYLTPEKANEQDSKPNPPRTMQPLNPEAIWAASRRCFCPGLPKPIRGIHELDMWRLLRGRNCQVCGEPKESSLTLNPENPWESGPGENGIRVIWPFALRCCGRCIPTISEKEVNLLFSSDCPSFLLPALPFAFISSSNNYITSILLRSTAHPPTLILTKHYYKPHIEDIRHRLDNVRELGNASADEWIKGLDGEGKDRLNEAVRWEQWEAKGGLRKVNQRSHPRVATTTACTNIVTKVSNAKGGVHSDRSTPQGVRLSTIFSADSGSPASAASSVHFPYPPPPISASFQPSWIPAAASYPENLLTRNPPSFLPPRPERNVRDVNEAKAARRAEIERRCAELDPPLLPNVLNHMANFQAATQISQPLTEQAWQVLKHRLLIQRTAAERKEKERVEQSQLLQAEYKQRRQQEAQLKETKESFDRGWASSQMPIRNKIANFADEIIENSWAGGRSVTKDNSPKFAADVLLYVRRRYYEELSQESEDSTSNGESSRNNNQDSASSQNLILENMKWLFDTKIKPLTEHFQKELFLCNGCDGNFKFYGLDSVVQHYAAKHTHNLSLGTQVVHWRAEWPEHPPFHPEPTIAKAAYYKLPTPQNTALQSLSVRDSPISMKQETYPPLTNPVIHPAHPQYSSSQYSPMVYQESYASTYQANKNYSPSAAQNYLHSTPVGSQPQDFQHNTNFGPVYPAPQSAAGGYTNAIRTNSVFQPPQSGLNSVTDRPAPPGYAYTDPYVQTQKASNWQGYGSLSRNYGDAAIPHVQTNLQARSFYQSYPEQGRDLSGQAGELYQQQIEEMAKHARDVWFATSGIKDIPQSVRIYVLIQHMVARFKKVYSNEPSLVMFIDGLDRNSLMKPVRSLNGLACKVCVTNGSRASGESNLYAPLPTGDRRLYTLPNLLAHFRTAHLENPAPFADQANAVEGLGLDWKLDMIELPETALIADLINATGLDDVKLELIAGVFPGVFPSRLPRMGHPGNAGPVPDYTGVFVSETRLPPKNGPEPFADSPLRGEGRIEKHQIDGSYSSFRESSQPARLSEPPGEDEYDPHKPALPSGVGLVHSRKAARTPSTDSGQQSALHTRPSAFHYVPSDASDRPHSTYNDTPVRRVAGDHHLAQHYEPSNRSRSRLSPPHRIETQLEDRFNDEQPGYLEQQTQQRNGHSIIVDPPVKRPRVTEDREFRGGSASFEEMRRSSALNEGASAADQFLDNLASSSDLKTGQKIIQLDREGTRSIVRREEHSQDRYIKKRIDSNTEPQGWRIDTENRETEEADPSTLSARNDSLKGRHYDGISSPHGRHSHLYDENYRSWSQIHRRPSESKLSRRSAETYYEVPQHTIIPDRYQLVEGVIEGSHIRDSRDMSFQASQSTRYRSRSRSPRPLPLSTTFFRPRSPVDDHRHESVYRVRSPSLRKDGHPQRIISYDYTGPERYEYVDDRNIAHNPVRQRVEYIPVRLRETAPIESSRYLITQSTDVRPPADYVRVDRSHPTNPVYDHPSYPPQQGQGHPTFSQGYRY